MTRTPPPLPPRLRPQTTPAEHATSKEPGHEPVVCADAGCVRVSTGAAGHESAALPAAPCRAHTDARRLSASMRLQVSRLRRRPPQLLHCEFEDKKRQFRYRLYRDLQLESRSAELGLCGEERARRRRSRLRGGRVIERRCIMMRELASTDVWPDQRDLRPRPRAYCGRDCDMTQSRGESMTQRLGSAYLFTKLNAGDHDSQPEPRRTVTYEPQAENSVERRRRGGTSFKLETGDPQA
eukprot:141015-Rhodomonas_salina.1